MSHAFRDERAALLDRIERLEAENGELRAAIEEQLAGAENRQAVYTRTEQDNEELRQELREAETEVGRLQQLARPRGSGTSRAPLAENVASFVRKILR